MRALHQHVELKEDRKVNGDLDQVNIFAGSIFWHYSNGKLRVFGNATKVSKMSFRRQLGNGIFETTNMNTNPGQRTLDGKGPLSVE